jgi:hypothetical protein
MFHIVITSFLGSEVSRLDFFERLVLTLLADPMAQADLARLTINLFHLYGFLAPGTDNLDLHVKAPFIKEKGDRALMIELRPPCVFICVARWVERSEKNTC